MLELLSAGSINDGLPFMPGSGKKNIHEELGLSFDTLLHTTPEESYAQTDDITVEVNLDDDTVRVEEHHENDETYSADATGRAGNSEIDTVNHDEVSTNKEETHREKSEKAERLAKNGRKTTRKDALDELLGGRDRRHALAKGRPAKNLGETVLETAGDNVIKFKLKELKPQLRTKIKQILGDVKNNRLDKNTANVMISSLIKQHMTKNLKKGNSRMLPGKQAAIGKKAGELFALDKGLKGKKVEKAGSEQIDAQKNDLLNIKQVKTGKQTPAARRGKTKNAPLTSGNNETVVKDIKTELDLTPVMIKNDPLRPESPLENGPRKILDQNKQAIFDQLTKNTKVVLSQNQTKFSTMIRPESLGRIDFKFVMKDGKMSGRMILQSEETASFFRGNVEEFKAVFQKANVELENLDIILAGNRMGQESFNEGGREQDFNNDDNHVMPGKKIADGNLHRFEENNGFVASNFSRRDMTNVNVVV